MFTQSMSSPSPGPQPASTATAGSTTTVSATRPSRLRGLSYLRNYTQTHILSRDGPQSGNNNTTTSTSSRPNNLARAATYAPSSATPLSNTNRFTLVDANSSASSRPSPPQRSASSVFIHAVSADDSSASATAQGATLSGPAATGTVTRTPAASTNPQPPADDNSNMTRTTSTTTGAAGGGHSEGIPSIRFSAYYDPRSARPSLTFPPITRSWPSGSEPIRVGRYSERDSAAGAGLGSIPTAAPVGFKSKVVSRRHCEFYSEAGKWYIKDVKSSSGTFLNHIRLSSPSQESKPWPVNDGDIIQLGIDYKGGEEMIYRCVKMRVELNRGWQNKLNTFNMATHKRLRTMGTESSSVSGSSSHDCSICLNSIAPCQSLFVAPCSHTWHFKCVRSLILSPQYPIFICPNCRAGADLEADVDEPEPADEWEEVDETKAPVESTSTDKKSPGQLDSPTSIDSALLQDSDVMDVTVAINTTSSPAERGVPHPVTEPLPITNPSSGSGRANVKRDDGTPSPPNGADGPITPRNDVGPWVFDGSAGGQSQEGVGQMGSLDAAAADIDMEGRTSSESSSPKND